MRWLRTITSAIASMFRRPIRTYGATTEIEWFQVSYDDDEVRLAAQPPGREPWTQTFRWNSVVRICFKAEDLLASDGIYVFTSARPESYAIPTEAIGGGNLWKEILRRGLFDPQLAIEAASSTGGLYCWPPPVVEERGDG